VFVYKFETSAVEMTKMRKHSLRNAKHYNEWILNFRFLGEKMTMFWWGRNNVFTHENAIPQNSYDFFKFVYIRFIVWLHCLPWINPPIF